MRVGRGGDRNRLHRAVGEDLIESGDAGSEPGGELAGGLRNGIAHIAQAHARLPGEVSAVNLADATGADQGNVDHEVPPLAEGGARSMGHAVQAV